NAAKYGALSRREGLVGVRWHWPCNGAGPEQLSIDWREIGGPAGAGHAKSREGAGVITDLVPYEVGGTADFPFHPQSGCCRLTLPGEWVRSGRQPSVERAQLAVAGYELAPIA